MDLKRIGICASLPSAVLPDTTRQNRSAHLQGLPLSTFDSAPGTHGRMGVILSTGLLMMGANDGVLQPDGPWFPAHLVDTFAELPDEVS